VPVATAHTAAIKGHMNPGGGSMISSSASSAAARSDNRERAPAQRPLVDVGAKLNAPLGTSHRQGLAVCIGNDKFDAFPDWRRSCC